MTTSRQIDEWMQRTRRYWYLDGISDAAMGLFLLLLGLLFVGESVTPPGSPLWLLWGTAGPLLLVGGAVAVGWLVRVLKERYTYPRAGYVTFEKQGSRRVARALAGFLLAAIIGAGIAVATHRLEHISFLYGLVFLGAFGYLSYRLGLRRYLLLAAWSLVLGITPLVFSLSLDQEGALFFIGVGAGMLVLGIVAWYRFDHSAPRQPERDDENRAGG
ncbi:MAG: hypothetical protein M1132_08855 [Chloroflexi bacterium]|nr:hypothetical protein [Chloroflexota bacterium]MCL5951816.1 hypothetical protein [Chloroflexota bacterium]